MTNQFSSSITKLWDNIKDVVQPKTNSQTQHSKEVNPTQEFVIIGLGRFGTSLAMSLDAYNHSVLAIDSDMKRVQEVSQLLPYVVHLDATNIEAMREVGVEAFDTGVVCIGNDFEANLLATVVLRKLNVRRVITKARTVTQQDILKKVGANEVILPEHEAGVRLGRRLAAVNFVDFLELTDDVGVVEIMAPGQLVGKTLKESQVRQKYGLAVIAIRRQEEVVISPRAEEVIQEGDILVVLGRTSDCERLQQE